MKLGSCERDLPPLLPQDLLDSLAFGKFVDELVQVAYLLHQGVVDFFHAHAAHDAFDERGIGVNPRRLGKEGFEVVRLGRTNGSFPSTSGAGQQVSQGVAGPVGAFVTAVDMLRTSPTSQSAPIGRRSALAWS